MSQIQVNNLTFSYEGSPDLIFDRVSLVLDTDWKLGFAGRNGKGKTTFLRLLMGDYEYQGTIRTGIRFDYFPYQIKAGDMERRAAELAERWKPFCEEWRVICELDRLGVDAEVLYRPFGTLSPGEQTKVMLAVLFAGENEFLLVDEPTNHLDGQARETIQEYLSVKKGFILVSHDRTLLDACVDHMLVLNRSTIEVQQGNFTTWEENKLRRDSFARRENEKHLREISKLKKAAAENKKWAEKNESTKIGFDPVKEHDRCKATRAYIGAKTKKMQSRVRNMEVRMQREIEEKEGLLQDIENPAELKLTPLIHRKEVLVRTEKFGMRYRDAGEPLFRDLDLEIRQGERVFLHGANGCGKSSLMRAILAASGEGGEMPWEETGRITLASGLVISRVSQDTSFLRGSIADFCRERNLPESLYCAILRQLDFGREQFIKSMEDYSEGQKKKALIAASLMTPAHLYLWDEPLNYIDVFSRIQIEDMILRYQPTMLVTEHDRRFREKIATRVVEIGNAAGYGKNA